MRRLTAWIGGVAGGVAAYRFWRRRSEEAPEPTPPEPDARAEELRAKLAESRDAEPAAEAVVAEKPPAEQVAPEEPGPESPAERRRRVHEEGRAAVDEMKSE